MAITSKNYQCKECGYEKNQRTNHYGNTYSFGNYSTCPKCPPWKRPNVWICTEIPPNHVNKPEPWKTVKLGDICEITKGKYYDDSNE